jgi:polyferredoxin
MGSIRRTSNLRLAVQLLFLILIALIAVSHSLEESGFSIPLVGSASLHSLCPFGGVVSIYNLAMTGSLVRKVHGSALVLTVIVAATGVAFGPVFCGWVCPMGTVQELVSRIGRKLIGERHNNVIPAGLDRYMRYLRYVVLGWVIWVTARSGQLVFADFDPYYALFNFWTGEVAVSALAILGVVLLGSLVVERPFCKYACPFGALLGLFNLIRVFGIKRSSRTCISCGLCDTACPMNIQVSSSGTVRDHQCVSCLECTSENACPRPRTVELAVGRIDPQAVEAIDG